MDETTFKQQLSEKLVDLRNHSELTLEEAAESSGLSEDQLQEYEAGNALPAVGELMNLGQLFGVSLNHFFLSGPPTARVEIVRSTDRWKVDPQTDTAAALNYSYEALAYRLTDKVMSPFHVEIPPSEQKNVKPLSHDGEEFHFILSGEVEMTIDQETYCLASGDSIYFDSRLPHTVRALEFQPARMLACLVNVHRRAKGESPMQRAH